jgi:hypothetical protein
LIVRTPHSNFAQFERAFLSGFPDLWIEYRSSSVRESLVGLPIIHIEQLEFPVPSIYELYISRSDEANPNCNASFTIDSSQIRGIGFSAPSLGGYTISYSILSTLETGYLVHDSIDTFYALFDNDTFYSQATLVPAQIVCRPTVSAPASPTPTEEFTFERIVTSHRKRIIIRFSGLTFSSWDW